MSRDNFDLIGNTSTADPHASTTSSRPARGPGPSAPGANSSKENTMATPRYVVKRIGNDYKIIRADAEGVTHNSLCIAGGAFLLLSALRSRGLFGLMKAAAGAGIMYHGVTGKNPIDAVKCYLSGLSVNPADKLQDQAGPSHQHDIKSPSTQTPKDEIDESSMESFPASDAPAHTRSTSTEVVGVE